MSNYQLMDLVLSEPQIENLARAINNLLPVNLMISTVKDGKKVPIMLTQRQINMINSKAQTHKHFMIKLSKAQLSKMRSGGFLPALAAILPSIGSFLMSTALPALATGALSGAATLAVNEIGKKIQGQGLHPLGMK